jgi:hypothetical protein
MMKVSRESLKELQVVITDLDNLRSYMHTPRSKVIQMTMPNHKEFAQSLDSFSDEVAKTYNWLWSEYHRVADELYKEDVSQEFKKKLEWQMLEKNSGKSGS